MHPAIKSISFAPAAPAKMSDTDRRDIVNHGSMFGPAALCKRLGKKWIVDFRGFGFPVVYSTKTAAIDAAQSWIVALRQQQS